MFFLRDNPKRNHVLNELIKTARPELAKTSRWFGGQSMTTVIISVNNQFGLYQFLGQFSITTHMLPEAMGDLHHSANIAGISRFHTGNREAVATYEFEPLRRAHNIMR